MDAEPVNRSAEAAIRSAEAVIRPARDDDGLDLIELIGSVFGEYPHCVLDVDGEMPELRAIATWAKAHAGGFWVAEVEGRIVGMVGYATAGDGIELKKLYVHRRARAFGLGGKLLGVVEAVAAESRARFIELWSDTRFTTAHAFYQRRGYEKGPTTRDLHDKSNSVEFYFRKQLS
jgi:putative acetyltransferase